MEKMQGLVEKLQQENSIWRERCALLNEQLQ